jgi:hypothetical protein
LIAAGPAIPVVFICFHCSWLPRVGPGVWSGVCVLMWECGCVVIGCTLSTIVPPRQLAACCIGWMAAQGRGRGCMLKVDAACDVLAGASVRGCSFGEAVWCRRDPARPHAAHPSASPAWRFSRAVRKGLWAHAVPGKDGHCWLASHGGAACHNQSAPCARGPSSSLLQASVMCQTM